MSHIRRAASRFALFLKTLAGATVVASLAACGGGGGDSDVVANTGNWGLNFQTFDAGASTLAPAMAGSTPFTVSWTAQRVGANPAYLVYAYLIPASAPTTVLDDNVLFMGATCGTPINGCDAAGSQVCNYNVGSTVNKRQIDCGSTRGLTRTLDRDPGNYLVIGRACYISTTLADVCSDKPAIPVTLQ